MRAPLERCLGGFLLLVGTGTRLDRNSVQGCNTGFIATGTGIVFTRNLAIGNSGGGYSLGDFAEFTRNAAIGNLGGGLALNSGATPGVILSNTFAGNGTALGLNCGMQNSTGLSVNATGNFWGAATGPGPDPADLACDFSGSTTVTSPFATKDFTPSQASLR